MYSEKRKDAESIIHIIERDIQNIKFWCESGYGPSVDRSDYDLISAKFTKAKEEFKKQTYSGYDESLLICYEIEALLKKIYGSIKNGPNYLANMIESQKERLNKINHDVREQRQKKIMNYARSITGIVVMYICYEITVGLINMVNSNDSGISAIGCIIVLIIGLPLLGCFVGGLIWGLSFNSGKPNTEIKKLKQQNRDVEEAIKHMEKVKQQAVEYNLQKQLKTTLPIMKNLLKDIEKKYET